jgi:DNA primase
MAVLQRPDLVGTELIQRAAQTAFTNHSLAVVRDGVAASIDAVESANWLARVIEEVPTTFAALVQQMGVAPLPERDEATLAPYARGVVASLIDKGLLARKADLLGQLQRADTTDRDAYNTLQRELVDVEAQRRRLRAE